MAATRWSEMADADSLAGLHQAAWRYAYSGIIPGIGLERMVARRGAAWWRRLHEGGERALVHCHDGGIAGYALVGPRRGGSGGEIYELYVRPECQGIGFGRRLFETARSELRARGPGGLSVWSLADNAIGCRFYRALGGREGGRASERHSGAILKKIRFDWA